jgi:CheY-like chemotaxis protein
MAIGVHLGIIMTADNNRFVIVIDDNISDIELFKFAWSNAGYNKTDGIRDYTRVNEAISLFSSSMAPKHMVSGILVDLLLFDAAGSAVVDIISGMSILRGIPVISWTGIDFGRHQTDRIRKSSTQVWTKPTKWMDWSIFVSRFYGVLNREVEYRDRANE